MSSNLNNRFLCKHLPWLLGMLLALAVSPSVLLAQEWDHFDGRDKVHDPTGAWLVRFHSSNDPLGKTRQFFLIVFHKGGTLTQNTQGESGFDPSSVPIIESGNNVISTALGGVWQKTGWNTFAGTLLDIEYHNGFDPASGDPPDVSVFQFTKEQFVGRLNPSGDQIVFSEVRWTHFKPDGTLFSDVIDSFPAVGVRIPLEILPKSAQTLPIPGK